ncbi:MAG: SPOR domain-containing protein [Treponema sp.]|nr:SPOR domain-containing protein [Treponema sp.]MCL2272686.1 SPOR domain-containing protein [Treponema sp.]
MNKNIILILLVVFAFPLFAQNSLDIEIQEALKITGRQGISDKERHDALVRLAVLRQLSGDIEGAARNWLEAAAAIPGQINDEALLACAYCLAAMGEWDRAKNAIEPLLSKSKRANFLHAGINAIQSGNKDALIKIANDPDYSPMLSEVFFLLWKTSGGAAAENWRRRLAVEFPQSPEGRLAAGDPVSAIMPSPFWLFLSGNESPYLIQSSPVDFQSGVKLQTGLFGQQVNAQAQITRLRQAGFSPLMEQRGDMWVVTVTADTARGISDLKAAGFDAFPVK